MRTNYVWSFLVAFILTLGTSIGQTTLIDEDFRSGEQPAGWTSDGVIFTTAAQGYANFDAPDAELISPSFDASAFGQIEVNFRVAKFEGGVDGPITVEVSVDGGDNFSVVGNSPVPSGSNYLDASFIITTLSDDMVLRFTRPDSPSKKRFRDLEVIASGTPSTDPGDVACDINVRVFSSTWGDNVTWQLTDSNNDVVLSGGTYGSTYNDEQTHIAVSPPYTFSITMNENNFCDNSPNWEISIGDDVVETGNIPAGCDTVIETYEITTDLTPCIPTCPAAGGLVLIDTSTTGATFAWSEVEEADSYDWFVFDLGANPETATAVANGNTSQTLVVVTDLNVNTNYQFYVQSVCGAEEGNLSSPLSFKTDCGAQSGDFLENFSTTPTGSLPECWNGITNSTASAIFNVTTFGTPFSAPNQLQATSSGDIDTEHFFVSPELTDLSNGRRVTFYSRQTTATAANMVEVGTMSDPADETTFVSLESFTLTGTAIQFFVVDFPDTATESHFAFRFSYNLGTGTSNFQTVYLDEISYEATPPCDFIDGLVVDSFDQNSVDFSWDALPNAVSYNWEVYAAGAIVGEDSPVVDGNSPTNSATATGLMPNTSYFVVVSGDCGPDDGVGANSAPATFKTLCDAVSGPISEDFEDTPIGTTPDCWSILNSAETTGAFNVTTGFAPVMQGARQLQVSSGNNDAVQRFLISPQLDDLFENNKRVTFLARTSSTVANNATVALGIMSDPTNPNTFIELDSWALTTTATQYQGDITFAFAEQFFALRFTYGATFITSLVDDINYFDIPACDVPLDLAVDGLSETDGEFSWSAVPNAESYNWVVVEQGGDPNENDDIVASGNSTTNSASVEGFEADTSYQLYVKSDCDALGEGEFSQPLSFFTGYCQGGPTSVADTQITSFEMLGEAGTALILADNCPAVTGVQDETALEILLLAGEDYTMSVTHGTCANTGFTRRGQVWIDFNQNLAFDSDETFATFESPVPANVTVSDDLTIEIPAGVEPGQYRMRVQLQETSVTPLDPCASYNWGSKIDFIVTVVDPADLPDCLPPVGLVVDEVTADSVEFSFDVEPSAEAYNWEIYTAGSVVGVDAPAFNGVSSTNSVLATGLDSNTPYFVVVKSDCGETQGLSSNTPPVNFRTDCDLFFADFNEGFENTAAGQIPFCWNRILNFTVGTPILDVTTFSTPAFGSSQVRFTASSDLNAELTLVSPELGDFDGTPKRVTFFARHSFSAGAGIEVGTMTDPDDASTFEVVESFILPADMQFFAVNFLDVTDETHFAFRATFSATFQTVLLDEITYEEIPACDVPLNVAGDVSSSSSADFEWDEVLGAESYDWIIVLEGADPTDASNILQSGNVEETEVTVGDLETNETYDFYVSANCGAEGVGNLSSPATVSISVCVDGVGPTSTFDTNIEGLELIGEAGTSLFIEDNCPAQTGVQLELGQEVLLIPGGSYELSIDHGSCGGYFNRRGKVWVDFDQSLSFDEDEVIGSFQNAATTSVENALLDLEIPSDLDFGVYRMRVVLQETTLEVTNPCNSFTWGNVIDFLITVVDPSTLPGDVPMDPAPTPTEDENLVISLFSNAYNDVPVDTWLTTWSAAQLEDIQIQGVDTKLYTNLDFAGVEMTGANSIDLDAANMTKFHVDFWTPNMTTVRVKLVDFGPDNAFGGGDDSEHEVVFEDLAIGEWNSLEIELSEFEGLVNTSNISQLIFSGLVDGVPGQGTLYVDNVYFSSGTFSSGEFNSVNFSYYPNPVKSHLNIQSANTVEKVEVYNVLGQRVLLAKPNAKNPSIEMGNLNAGVYLMNVSINGTQKTFQVIKE